MVFEGSQFEKEGCWMVTASWCMYVSTTILIVPSVFSSSPDKTLKIKPDFLIYCFSCWLEPSVISSYYRTYYIVLMLFIRSISIIIHNREKMVLILYS